MPDKTKKNKKTKKDKEHPYKKTRPKVVSKSKKSFQKKKISPKKSIKKKEKVTHPLLMQDIFANDVKDDFNLEDEINIDRTVKHFRDN